MEYELNILSIGAGYVGGPTMAKIAQKCPQCRVCLVDINIERIAAWNSPDLPIYEPGLDEVVFARRDMNLFFSTDIEGEIKKADVIFVSVNTPTKTFGEGAGKASDLQYIEKTARSIAKYATGDKIIVEKSTLPVRTAEALETVLRQNDKGLKFEVVSNPEFLAEGTAMADLENPDRVLIGSRQTKEGLAAAAVIVGIYANWIPKDRLHTTNMWSSELTKLAANAFLAQRISSVNALSALCEVTGADVGEVADAIGFDSRIGSKFLKSSVGFGGSCFKKDILNLVYLCDHYGLGPAARYWESVVELNEWQQARFVQNMVRSLFNSIAGKKIGIFGFAFKADTADTRESPALYVVKALLEERADLHIHDPKALPNAREDLRGLPVTLADDPYEAAKDAHAIAILTEWKMYRSLDWQRIYNAMEKPAWIFDGRNILDHQTLHAIGFNVRAIGKEPLVNQFAVSTNQFTISANASPSEPSRSTAIYVPLVSNF